MVLSRKSWVFCTLVLLSISHTSVCVVCIAFFLLRERFINCYFLLHDLIFFGENDDDDEEVDNEETYEQRKPYRNMAYRQITLGKRTRKCKHKHTCSVCDFYFVAFAISFICENVSESWWSQMNLLSVILEFIVF